LTGDPVGGSWRFIANPTSCPATPATITATGTTYGADGSNASTGAPVPAKSVDYPVTNCSNTSFKPAIASEFFQADPLDGSTYDFNDPGASVATVGSNLATNDSLNYTRMGRYGFGTSVFNAYTGRRIKNVWIQLPDSSGFYYDPSFGSASQKCTGTGVTATSVWQAVCPASGIAQVGSISIASPLFSEPLVGKVSLITKTVPYLGIDVNPAIPGNPAGVTLRFLVIPNYEGPTNRTVFRLSYLPDLPLSFDLDLSGATARAGGLLSSLIFGTVDEGDPTCVPTSSVRAEFTSSNSEATPSIRSQDTTLGPC
jgi:hypothetical protein